MVNRFITIFEILKVEVQKKKPFNIIKHATQHKKPFKLYKTSLKPVPQGSSPDITKVSFTLIESSAKAI